MAKTLQKILAKQGMKFKLGTKVTSVKKEGSGVKVEVEPSKGGAKEAVSSIELKKYIVQWLVKHLQVSVGPSNLT